MGGLLLLIMLLVSIVALCVASWHRGITGRRKRGESSEHKFVKVLNAMGKWLNIVFFSVTGLLNGRRVYEIPTSVPDAHLNGNAHNGKH